MKALTKEQLLAILAGYRQQHEQHIANANAALGAAQAVEALLKEYFSDALPDSQPV
jgi:hypothetical protein